METQDGKWIFASTILLEGFRTADFKVTSIRKENNLVAKTQNSNKFNYGIMGSLIGNSNLTLLG